MGWIDFRRSSGKKLIDKREATLEDMQADTKGKAVVQVLLPWHLRDRRPGMSVVEVECRDCKGSLYMPTAVFEEFKDAKSIEGICPACLCERMDRLGAKDEFVVYKGTDAGKYSTPEEQAACDRLIDKANPNPELLWKAIREAGEYYRATPKGKSSVS